MKEKRKEKYSSSSKKHHKSKKHKKKYESSSDSDSSDEEMEWVEASPISSTKTNKKRKKKHKKYARSSSSDTESEGGKMEDAKWVETSSSSLKAKKKKNHSKKSKSSSSSHSESSNEESKSESLPSMPVEKRDSWMNEESFVRTLSKDEIYVSSKQKRAESIKEKRDKEEKIQKERELNPHWKNEGSGLPEKETTVDSLSLPSTSVGDGGYSWLKKAYYRIQEQAQREGRSMEEVAVERWGSLSKLTSLIEEAEERMKSHPDWKHSKSRDRYRQDDRSSRMQFKKPSSSYESEKSFNSSFQFRKPSDDSKNRKVLNQFKSSRKISDTSYRDERTDYKNSDSSNSSYNQYLSNLNEGLDVKESKSDNAYRVPAWKKRSTNLEEDLEVKKSNSDNAGQVPAWKKRSTNLEGNLEIKRNNTDSHIPAWKKQKSPEVKGVSDHYERQIAKSPPKEIDNIPIMYSENDLNKLAAKQIKAEMMGNTSLAQKLQEQLDEARRIVEEKGFAKHSKVVEEVILSKIDNQGQARPIQISPDKISDYKKKKVNKKYFDDGSSHSLKQMFEREKLTTADDQLEMFVAASTQSNETAEIDYESGHISKKLSKKLSSTRQEERDIGKAIQQHQKRTASLENCSYCLDQPKMKKHLIVDVGENVYLSLPSFQSMTEGHCLIIPKDHVSSFLSLDENEWREVNDFKNQLRNVFRSENKSVIFLETSMHFRHFPHAVLECIPVPEEEGDSAPFYFKKAIQESEAEWAHNKKLIDLTNKGLRHSVPKSLPYFYVEFDPKVHAGFAHVIEDEKDFPRNFGKEVVGGMLDIDYHCLYKNKREDPLKKSKEVVDFEKKWKTFKNVK